jgi:hypothetical protein
MLYIVPDEPKVTFDPLPAHFREALIAHIDRLEFDFLAAKILLRSLLAAGPGEEGADKESTARHNWVNAIGYLMQRVTVRGATSLDRAPLLTGGNLDEAIAMMARGRGIVDIQTARHIAVSALADRTDDATVRIRQVFGYLAAPERSS